MTHPWVKKWRSNHPWSEALDFPEQAFVKSRYIIAAPPRSGSTLLSAGLWGTSEAGAPSSYFSGPVLTGFRNRWGVPRQTALGFLRWRTRSMLPSRRGWPSRHLQSASLQEYSRLLLRHRTSPNGVFGLTLHWSQADLLLLGNGLDPQTEFPDAAFVFLTRRDTVRQAVSLSRAHQSKAFQHPRRDEAAPEREAVYNYSHIRRSLHRVEHEEQGWEKYFNRHDISPIRLFYEDLASDFKGTVKYVLDELELSFIEIPPPATEMTGDLRTDEWAVRFIDDMGTRRDEDPEDPATTRPR